MDIEKIKKFNFAMERLNEICSEACITINIFNDYILQLGRKKKLSKKQFLKLTKKLYK